MARAYKKTYLNGAMRNLAMMMDCGVRKYGYPIEDFYGKFLASEVSRQFAKGNPRYLVGLSGAELADTVVEASGDTVLPKNDGTYTVGPEYWAGWVLAYYQWLTRRSFAYMHRKGLGISEVVAMYYPLHEADLSKFAAAADDIIEGNDNSKQSTSHEAILSSSEGFTAFSFGEYNIRFRAPYSLERYVDVVTWDDGYLVVMAKYKHNTEPEEEYIDLKPILEGLYIDSTAFLKPIKKVRIAYARYQNHC